MQEAAMLADRIRTEFPSMRVDESVLRKSLGQIKSSAQHFYRFRDGNLVAAFTDDLPFSTKKQCTLAVWLGAGGGMALFREWVKWLDSRPAIRAACFTPMFDDSRLERVLGRYGFVRHGGIFIRERG